MLEPDARKRARPVLRGPERRKAVGLPGEYKTDRDVGAVAVREIGDEQSHHANGLGSVQRPARHGTGDPERSDRSAAHSAASTTAGDRDETSRAVCSQTGSPRANPLVAL